MFFGVKIFLLVGLIRFVINKESPFLCASIYTLSCVFLAFMSVTPFALLLLKGVFLFGFSSLYFWLLDKFQEGVLWWIIMVVGLLILIAV